jgi:UPF0755 protein
MLVVIIGLGIVTVGFVTGMSRTLRAGIPVSLSDVQAYVSGDDEPLSDDDRTRRFTVHSGETATSIADRLESEGFVKSSRSFRIQARSLGLDVHFEAGDYDLSPSMRPTEIMGRLQQGRNAGTSLTIPEGWRLAQIADALETKRPGSRADLLTLTSGGGFDFPFLADRPQGASLEGYLFPDTYTIDKETTPRRLVETMLRVFGQRVGPSIGDRAKAKGLTVHQVVTLASIVEREARVGSERSLIAAVYLNRLKRDMLMQADPTVQFALRPTNVQPADGAYWKVGLTNTDLQTDSPYNTYRRKGLPPGPICSPGLESIQAVLDAGTTDMLYFVARSDGSHLFAATLAEHNANVAKVGGR